MQLNKLIIAACLVGLVVGFKYNRSNSKQNFNQPQQPKQSPVVLIPGDGGSQAYASTKDESVFSIWINIKYFFEFSQLGKYFYLTYDPTTGKTKDSPYANISFPGWGETWSIEELDTTHHTKTKYFGDIVDELTKDSFYITNKTLRGTPFDFRKAPNENSHFFEKLQFLIEETFLLSGNRRVMLLGHSLGSLYGINFLKRMSSPWKKKYVRGYISISGPLAGSVKALKMQTSGDNLGIFLDRPIQFREVMRTFPSTAFLMPNPQYFPSNFPLIITPERNYSAFQYDELFNDIKFPLGNAMRDNTKYLHNPDTDYPDVDELYCLHGYNMPTSQQLLYKPATFYRTGFPDQEPTEIMGDGDGTVSIRSLLACTKWPGVVHKTFDKAEHMKIVHRLDVIQYIKSILENGDL